MYYKNKFSSLLISICCLVGSLAGAADKPNIVVFFVDDLGWMDIGANGADLHETPNIDRLAAEGLLFTDGYSASNICSPSRASFMTGMAPERHDVTDWISGWWHYWDDERKSQFKLEPPEFTQEFELHHKTIGDRMQEAGYRTAFIGKWHLCPTIEDADKAEQIDPYYPQYRGFDVNIAGNQYGAPGSYYWPYEKHWRLRKSVANFPPAEETKGLYLTDMLTNYAEGIIQDWKEDPFFILFSYYQVHTPIQGRADLVHKYREKLAAGGEFLQTDPEYAAMVESVDRSVGRVHARLERLGLDKNTLIIFTSDNGGLDKGDGTPANNFPLRDGKGTPYEGGVRVPMIVKWPNGGVEAGSVSREPMITHDILPTILDVVDLEIKPSEAKKIDGLSLLPILKDPSANLDREALFWHYPHYHIEGSTPYTAVRSGDWRAIHFYEDDRIELYNLKDDLGERNDLSAEMPEKASEMRKMIEKRRDAFGLESPQPNPLYKGE